MLLSTFDRNKLTNLDSLNDYAFRNYGDRMDIREHIEAGRYPKDEKGRALVPTRKGGTATILSTDLGLYIVAYYDGAARDWRPDGEHWGLFDNCRDELLRLYDLLPPSPRKVEVKGYALVARDGRVAEVRTVIPDRLAVSQFQIVELTGSYEEEWK